MQNALLVGLSRQSGARPRNGRGRQQHREHQHHRLQGRRFAVRGISQLRRARRPDRQPRELRARPRRLARYEPGADRAHRQSARCRRSTAKASWWCRRRAANATPATARCRSTPPASSSPATAIRCSATAARSRLQPNDRQVSDQPRRHDQRARRQRRKSIRCAASFGWSPSTNPQQLQKDGSSTFNATGRRAAASRRRPRGIMQGAVEKSNVRGVVEMSRMIEITRSYTQIASLLQQQSDLGTVGDRQARRSSELTMKGS